MQVAECAQHLEPGFLHGFEVRAAGDENDILSAGSQTGAEVTADTAATDDCDLHLSVFSSYWSPWKDRHVSRSRRIFESARCREAVAQHKIHPAAWPHRRCCPRSDRGFCMNRPEKLPSTIRPHIASRMEGIEPFHVVVLVNRAKELEAQGRSIANMVVGEPDAPTPPLIAAAGIRADAGGRISYTPSLGIRP